MERCNQRREIGAENLENLSLQEQKLKYEIDLKKLSQNYMILNLRLKKKITYPKKK